MSGRNIFLVLIALIVGIGVFVLVTDPGDVPAIPVQAPVVTAPRAAPAPPPPPTVDQRVEPVPALDDVTNDAAAEVERLKKEQDEMDAKPPAPDAAEPAMR